MCKLPLRASTGLADYVLFEPHRSGLKFYNLHQTLNTSINALNSFTDIYCISSARSGFVFFISFTSFFLIVICLHHILSGTSCQACCLELVARAFQVRGNAQKPRVHFNGLNSELTPVKKPAALFNGACSSLLDPRSCECRPARLLLTSYCVPQDQGSSSFDAKVCYQRKSNCSRKNNYP